ncbi:MAG: pseudouridine synthase [Eubacteriales bacterium]|nr:pseudouridine synthase [Eubacteriales bacterium]
MASIRLDKYLADAGLGTRTEVKTLIRKGRITVNQEICRKPETKLDPDKDVVEADGKSLSWAEHHYYMLHKPAGCVTALTDRRDPTVMELMSDVAVRDLFPVGRLDKDTEGLLLITDDGELAHRLLSPSGHVDKTYFVRITGKVSEDGARALTEGLDIGEEKKTLPARLEILKEADESEVLLTIQEGKFHQVKRMFHAVGNEVIYLKRMSMGSLVLDEHLAAGCFRELSEEEIRMLKEDAKLV